MRGMIPAANGVARGREGCSFLKLLAFGSLAPQEERLGILAFAADLEGPEVLEPETVGRFRVRFSPELQLIEVIRRDLAISKPIEQMISEGRREIRPLNRRQSITEGTACKLLLETPLFRRIGGIDETIGKLEERPFFLFPSLEPRLDQLNDDSAGAHPLPPGDGLHAPGDFGGKTDASAVRCLCGGHAQAYTTLHHSASTRARAPVAAARIGRVPIPPCPS